MRKIQGYFLKMHSHFMQYGNSNMVISSKKFYKNVNWEPVSLSFYKNPYKIYVSNTLKIDVFDLFNE